ncbi:hypothetical protein [Teredinibacter franksiae]|uniref:hypothetical protein n=1 Tax=Teredinibacter franksiae TaxID=2761453 RepID=UPI001623B020|nr:hypothetical protein [Teredinibacter franksiae]
MQTVAESNKQNVRGRLWRAYSRAAFVASNPRHTRKIIPGRFSPVVSLKNSVFATQHSRYGLSTRDLVSATDLSSPLFVLFQNGRFNYDLSGYWQTEETETQSQDKDLRVVGHNTDNRKYSQNAYKYTIFNSASWFSPRVIVNHCITGSRNRQKPASVTPKMATQGLQFPIAESICAHVTQALLLGGQLTAPPIQAGGKSTQGNHLQAFGQLTESKRRSLSQNWRSPIASPNNTAWLATTSAQKFSLKNGLKNSSNSAQKVSLNNSNTSALNGDPIKSIDETNNKNSNHTSKQISPLILRWLQTNAGGSFLNHALKDNATLTDVLYINRSDPNSRSNKEQRFSLGGSRAWINIIGKPSASENYSRENPLLSSSTVEQTSTKRQPENQHARNAQAVQRGNESTRSSTPHAYAVSDQILGSSLRNHATSTRIQSNTEQQLSEQNSASKVAPASRLTNTTAVIKDLLDSQAHREQVIQHTTHTIFSEIRDQLVQMERSNKTDASALIKVLKEMERAGEQRQHTGQMERPMRPLSFLSNR